MNMKEEDPPPRCPQRRRSPHRKSSSPHRLVPRRGLSNDENITLMRERLQERRGVRKLDSGGGLAEIASVARKEGRNTRTTARSTRNRGSTKNSLGSVEDKVKEKKKKKKEEDDNHLLSSDTSSNSISSSDDDEMSRKSKKKKKKEKKKKKKKKKKASEVREGKNNTVASDRTKKEEKPVVDIRPEPERRRNAYNLYNRYGRPNKEKFLNIIVQNSSHNYDNIYKADIELLPWVLDGKRIDPDEMRRVLLSNVVF